MSLRYLLGSSHEYALPPRTAQLWATSDVSADACGLGDRRPWYGFTFASAPRRGGLKAVYAKGSRSRRDIKVVVASTYARDWSMRLVTCSGCVPLQTSVRSGIGDTAITTSSWHTMTATLNPAEPGPLVSPWLMLRRIGGDVEFNNAATCKYPLVRSSIAIRLVAIGLT